MQTRLVVVRHGETSWNKTGKMQGHIDVPLNETGEWQAVRTGERLGHPDYEELASAISLVVASDLSRACRTAALVVDRLNACRSRKGLEALTVTTDARLRETHLGGWQGVSWAEAAASEPELAVRWNRTDPEARPPGTGGESFVARYGRVTDAITDVVARAGGGTALVVTHGGCLQDIARLCTGTPPGRTTRLRRPNAAINVVAHTVAEDSPAGFCPAAAAAAAESAAEASEPPPEAGQDPGVLCTEALVRLGGTWSIEEWGTADHLRGPPSGAVRAGEAAAGSHEEPAGGGATPAGHDDMPATPFDDAE